MPVKNRTRTITPGMARGKLLGGNLTVFTSIIGSPYVPDFAGAILFLEDVQEAPYRIDRMFTQLKLAGILDKVKGVVWGTCSKCDPGDGFASLTIPDVLDDHVKPLERAGLLRRDDRARRTAVHAAARCRGGDRRERGDDPDARIGGGVGVAGRLGLGTVAPDVRPTSRATSRPSSRPYLISTFSITSPSTIASTTSIPASTCAKTV